MGLAIKQLLAPHRAELGDTYENLGKPSGLYLKYSKTAGAWSLQKLNCFERFFRWLGCFKETRIDFITQKLNEENQANPFGVSRLLLRKIFRSWSKAHPNNKTHPFQLNPSTELTLQLTPLNDMQRDIRTYRVLPDIQDTNLTGVDCMVCAVTSTTNEGWKNLFRQLVTPESFPGIESGLDSGSDSCVLQEVSLNDRTTKKVILIRESQYRTNNYNEAFLTAQTCKHVAFTLFPYTPIQPAYQAMAQLAAQPQHPKRLSLVVGSIQEMGRIAAKIERLDA